MADKQIFELPDITLEILTSGVEISFVAQVQGYGLDFQVPLDVMSEYLNSGYILGVSGGDGTPDNASGNNGDIYFKSNGTVYQKVSGVWTVKANLPAPYIPTQFLMPVGQSLPYTVGTDLTNALIVTTYLCLPGGVRKISSQEYDVQMSGASTSFGTISTIKLYGHDDGAGNNLDDLWVVISKG